MIIVNRTILSVSQFDENVGRTAPSMNSECNNCMDWDIATP
jgi:hypothetical protein